MTGELSKTRRGRPKGARNVKAVVLKIARERHPVKEGDRVNQLSTVELLLRALIKKAMAGEVQAEKHLERLRDQLAPVQAIEAGVLVVPEPMSMEEWTRYAAIYWQARQRHPPESF